MQTPSFNELIQKHAKDLSEGKVLEQVEEAKEPETLHDVPTLYRDAKFSDFPKNLNPNASMFFWSKETGTGKTHLAWAYYINMRKNSPKERPLFSTFGALQLRLRASMDKGQESEQSIIQEFSTRKLLILDDLGGLRVGNASDYSTQMIYEIINNRYSWKRQTIITSNKGPDEMAEVFDNRIASRFAAMFTILELDGEDRRFSSGK